MPAMRFVNGNATTTSANSQTAIATVVTPSGQTGFPSSPQFTILERQTGEILLVTAVAATWTVQRGYAGTAAAPITAGDNLDFSVTREMLLGGFVAKLDEATLSVDTPNAVISLAVPSGLPFLANLKIRLQANATSDGYLQMRFNNDTSNTYEGIYAYWGSSSTSNVWPVLTFGRFWVGNQITPQVSCDADIEIGSADSSDRWKTWVIRQWLRNSTGGQFNIIHSGAWKPATQAPITSIQFSADVAQNGAWAGGTLRAGLRATLYGLP